MVQACLPELHWPKLTRSFLKAETTFRRSAGLEAPAVKAPFMPHIAIALDSWLESRTGSRRTLSLECASAAILLSYVFGWRASTTGALRVTDCTFATNMFRFSERFCKGAVTSLRYFRLLDLPEQCLPGLSRFLHMFIASAPEATLFSFGSVKNGLPGAL